MNSKLYKLLIDIEEFLIVYIDQAKDYDEFETVQDFMNRQEPEIQALYNCFIALSDKYFPEDKC